jgi:hypothetical protein
VVIEGFTGGVGTQPVPVVRWTADGRSLTEEHLTLDRNKIVT